MKKVIMKAGYTVEVVSWENDGDNYNTLKLTVADKDEALALKGLAMLSSRDTNHEGGAGNANNWDDITEGLIEDYMKDNPILLPDDWTPMEEDKDYRNIWRKINGELLGYSEWYVSRVCESVTIFYTEKDVEVEVVEC